MITSKTHVVAVLEGACCPGARQTTPPAMSGRLASFRGPSTPTSSPVQRQPTTPKSPARPTESTYHRKLRACLLELRGITETWDDLVLVDGLKAAKSLVDTRTELEYALTRFSLDALLIFSVAMFFH